MICQRWRGGKSVEIPVCVARVTPKQILISWPSGKGVDRYRSDNGNAVGYASGILLRRAMAAELKAWQRQQERDRKATQEINGIENKRIEALKSLYQSIPDGWRLESSGDGKYDLIISRLSADEVRDFANQFQKTTDTESE